MLRRSADTSRGSAAHATLGMIDRAPLCDHDSCSNRNKDRVGELGVREARHLTGSVWLLGDKVGLRDIFSAGAEMQIMDTRVATGSSGDSSRIPSRRQ